MRLVVEQSFFYEFAFNRKHLKHSSNFEFVVNVRNDDDDDLWFSDVLLTMNMDVDWRLK